jgi:hypothetical protein
MERESVLHGINSLQSFKMLTLKPNGQIKTWVRTTENHPIHQSLSGQPWRADMSTHVCYDNSFVGGHRK